MRKLVLVGGGGHCRSVIDTAMRMHTYDEIVVTDPKIETGTKIFGCTVVGTDDSLERLYQEGFEYAFISLGSVRFDPFREKLAKKVASIGFQFPVIRDPSAIVADSVIIEEGTFIGKNTIINADVRIGKHCIINTGAIIEHECIVGDFSHISVGTVLCGEVIIGKNCMIGAQSTVIQCIEIRKECVVGAGAVVTMCLPDNSTAVGVPARIL